MREHVLQSLYALPALLRRTMGGARTIVLALVVLALLDGGRFLWRRSAAEAESAQRLVDQWAGEMQDLDRGLAEHDVHGVELRQAVEQAHAERQRAMDALNQAPAQQQRLHELASTSREQLARRFETFELEGVDIDPIPDGLRDSPSQDAVNSYIEAQIANLAAQCSGINIVHGYLYLRGYCGRVDDAVRTLRQWQVDTNRMVEIWHTATRNLAQATPDFTSRQVALDQIRVREDEAQRALARWEDARAQLTTARDAHQAQLAIAQAQVAQRTHEALRTGRRRAVEWLKAHWWLAVCLPVVAALLSLCGVLVKYYVAVPMLAGRGFRLVEKSPQGELRADAANGVVSVHVSSGDTLVARPECLRQVPPGLSRTQFWYGGRRSWGLAMRYGLCGHTRVAVPRDGDPVTVKLAPRGVEAAGSVVLRVDLDDHPGVAIVPDHLVALTEGLTLSRVKVGVWNWFRGSRRSYMVLSGTGSVWLEGFGSVVAESVAGQERCLNPADLLAFDGRLWVRPHRVGTLLPVLRSASPMVELSLRGTGTYVWQKSAKGSARGDRPIALLERVFSLMGRLM